MRPAEIQERREALNQRQRELDAEAERLKGEFRALTHLCQHPKPREFSCMGENCKDCPDCGYVFY